MFAPTSFSSITFLKSMELDATFDVKGLEVIVVSKP
jgi:hypothetical protein